MIVGATAEMTRPTANNTMPPNRTRRGPFQSANAPATTVALSCVANAAPEATGYQAAASNDATTAGMIVVAASSSKATSVMRRTEPIANPISAEVHEARACEEEVASAGMLTILLAASVLPGRARVQ